MVWACLLLTLPWKFIPRFCWAQGRYCRMLAWLWFSVYPSLFSFWCLIKGERHCLHFRRNFRNVSCLLEVKVLTESLKAWPQIHCLLNTYHLLFTIVIIVTVLLYIVHASNGLFIILDYNNLFQCLSPKFKLLTSDHGTVIWLIL